MARRLSYTERARDDLDQVRAWLTQPGSGSAARRWLVALRNDIRRLMEYPCLFPVGPHTGVRELAAAGDYRVLYRVVPDTGRNDTAGDVRVLRIFGPGQERADI